MKPAIRIPLAIYLLLLFCLGMSCSKSKGIAEENETPASNYYYWYKNEKIPLFLKPGKKYILIASADEEKVNAYLSAKNVTIITEAEVLNISRSIQMINPAPPPEQKWMLVDVGQSLVAEGSPILYEGPFFATKETGGDDIGLSHLFYIKLKQAGDIDKLNALALTNKVEIIGNNQYMPLRYTLASSKNSLGNALEMANKFYETGNFEAGQADLMAPMYPASDVAGKW